MTFSNPPMSQVPWFVRSEARNMAHTGPIKSAVAGRTDHHPISVPGGSYVVPADIVSGIGEGNSENGHKVLSSMFAAMHSGPYGMRGKFAKGGQVGAPVPIMAAGGEYVIDPQTVAIIGHGNLDHGHKVLDAWVKQERSKLIKTLKKLPGPKKS